MTTSILPVVLLGLFDRSSDDGDDIDRIADRLGASPSATDVERRLDSLGQSIDRIVSAADLPDSQEPSPDSDPVSKAESLRRAIETDRIRIEEATPGRAGGRDGAATEAETVRQAARSVSRDVRPSASVSGRLLDQLAGARRASESQIEETLQEALDRLDEHERASDVVDRTDGIDSVAELAERRRSQSRRRRREESDRDRLREAVSELLTAVDVEVTEDDDLDRRVREATRKVRERESGFDADPNAGSFDRGAKPEAARFDAAATADSGRGTDEDAVTGAGGDAVTGADEDADEDVRTAVRRARESATPRSREARDLFEALEAGRTDPAADALETAATRLDEMATARSMLDSVSPGDVSELATSIDDRLADHDGPVADRLAERVEELESRLDRIDETNRVLLFAAHEELTFYDRQLLATLDSADDSGNGAATDAEAVSERVSSLRERRETIETDYVEERSDHNHSIPLYFLSIADTYLTEAEDRLDAGRPERAAGICAVTEAVIDHVEGLYDQNQYSVMLRSLRG
ncbi:coiled-coil domain-containing protein [Halopenitus persicus]|uniref:Uncharacterized protein n=1 Tax=Halopenitus persicus TaxID=1048396 RepID=A0A1H3MRC1_9EURY|nr:hypothetical protein [Halopenitus persicus]SDY79044.1 hypothetical protein SAMN05216564_11049 [Halopenitus persicus]